MLVFFVVPGFYTHKVVGLITLFSYSPSQAFTFRERRDSENRKGGHTERLDGQTTACRANDGHATAYNEEPEIVVAEWFFRHQGEHRQ